MSAKSFGKSVWKTVRWLFAVLWRAIKWPFARLSGTKLWRRSVIITKRVFRKAKPTEWVTAFTGLLTVCSAIVTALVLLFNGFFDQKKSELEVKKSELTIQITKAEMDRDRLADAMGNLETKVSEARIALKIKEKELSDLNAQLRVSKLTAEVLKIERDEAQKWERIREVFAKFEDRGSSVQLKTFRRSDKSASTSNIFGIEVKSLAESGRTTAGQRKDVEEILSAARQLPSVQFISIDNIDLRPIANQITTGFPFLTELHLTRAKLTDETMAVMLMPTYCPRINVSGNNIAKLQWIPTPSNLEFLDVSGTRVTDDELTKVLEKNSKLKELRLAGTVISDKVLKMPSISSKRLIRLVCNDTNITTDGLKEYIKSSKTSRIVCSTDQLSAEEGNKIGDASEDDLTLWILKGKYRPDGSYDDCAHCNKKNHYSTTTFSLLKTSDKT